MQIKTEDSVALPLRTNNGPNSISDKFSGSKAYLENGTYTLSILPSWLEIENIFCGLEVASGGFLIHQDLQTINDGLPFLVVHKAGGSYVLLLSSTPLSYVLS